MTAAGCAVVEELIRPGFLERVRDTGEYLRTGLVALSGRFALGEVRGKGLLLALDLKQEIAEEVVEISREQGLLLNAPRPDTLRFMPALTVNREEVDGMLCILGNVFAERSAGRSA